MEYIVLGCGALYLFRKKKLKFSNFKINSPGLNKILNFENVLNKQIKRENELLDYLNLGGRYKNNNFENRIYDQSTRLIEFNSYECLDDITVSTDADKYGGDTTVEVNYDIKHDSLVLEGNFEMKNKSLIETDVMFARLSFRNFALKRFDKVNIVRICAKPNGNRLKFGLHLDLHVETLIYTGIIYDDSHDFQVYEIPLKNLKSVHDKEKKFLSENFKLLEITIQCESKKEVAFNFCIKFIDLCYDHKAENIYVNYSQPIFLRI